MSDDGQVLPPDPPEISTEFTIQQKAAIEAMMAKALVANSAKEHDKGKEVLP